MVYGRLEDGLMVYKCFPLFKWTVDGFLVLLLVMVSMFFEGLYTFGCPELQEPPKLLLEHSQSPDDPRRAQVIPGDRKIVIRDDPR